MVFACNVFGYEFDYLGINDIIAQISVTEIQLGNEKIEQLLFVEVVKINQRVAKSVACALLLRKGAVQLLLGDETIGNQRLTKKFFFNA